MAKIPPKDQYGTSSEVVRVPFGYDVIVRVRDLEGAPDHVGMDCYKLAWLHISRALRDEGFDLAVLVDALPEAIGE